MTPKELGEEPAMPNGPCPSFADDSQYGQRGLTKRETFAMAAMQGIAGNSHDSMVGADAPTAARWAVEYADYLLEELAKSQP